MIVHISGTPPLVDLLLDALDTWVCRQQNFALIQEHGTIISVELDPKEPVGASLYHPKSRKHIAFDVKPGGQLEQALGSRTTTNHTPFAIIRKVQERDCESIQDLKKAIRKAACKGETLRLQLKVMHPERTGLLCRVPVLAPADWTDMDGIEAVATLPVDAAKAAPASTNELPFDPSPSKKDQRGDTAAIAALPIDAANAAPANTNELPSDPSPSKRDQQGDAAAPGESFNSMENNAIVASPPETRMPDEPREGEVPDSAKGSDLPTGSAENTMSQSSDNNLEFKP